VTAREYGGRAFPSDSRRTTEFGGTGEAHPGMSLRDYFAAKAMQAIVASMPRIRDRPDADLKAIAIGAYDYADAMLAAREGRW